MNNKYLGKYRNESARAPWWDYSRNGAYFITINTKNRERLFGEIQDGIMNLSDVGQLANTFWLEIPDHFPGVLMDAHIVMPNHVHGILVIDKMDHDKDMVRTPNLGVPTGGTIITTDTDTMINTTINTPNHRTQQASQKWKPQTIGVIINQFKRKCTIDAWKINPNFAWQSRFHDHIIRNEHEFLRIRDYIINNPKNWETDSLG